MATIGKVIRVANPRRKSRKRFASRMKRNYRRAAKRTKNTRSRRKPNARRRKFALRMKRNSKGRFVKKANRKRRAKKSVRNYRRRSNPSRVRRPRKSYTRSRRTRRSTARRRSNPVLIELGAINPRKKRSNVAKTRRRRSRRRNSRRRRVTAVVAPVRRRRRRTRVANRRRRHSNPVRTYRRRHHRRRRANGRRHYRRNPSLFGRSGGKDLLMMTGGVLVGVAATKYIPTLLPASIVSSIGGGTPIMGVVITAAGAFLAGWAARKFVGEPFGDAVLLGGLAQAGSQLLNVIAPPQLSSALALSGMGDIIPGMFVVPQNPIKAGMPVPVAPAPAKAGMGAFRGAFGGRR